MRWRLSPYKGYLISSCGKVWSCKFKRIMKTFKNRGGYENIKLTDGKGNYTHISIHRLVAISFIDNPDNKLEVNHLDGDKYNNDVSNLEWATRSENGRHAYSIGLKKGYSVKGEKAGNSKLTDNKVIEIIKLRNEGNKIKEIGDMFGVTDVTISNIYSGKTWKHIERSNIS